MKKAAPKVDHKKAMQHVKKAHEHFDKADAIMGKNSMKPAVKKTVKKEK